jgi:hypothetical protein
MRGAKLRKELEAGNKEASTRAWGLLKTQEFRSLVGTLQVVRVQTNYAFSSIFGWALLTRIDGPGPVRELVTKEVLVAAGCGHMTVDEYILAFCMVVRKDDTDEQHKTEVEAPEVVVVWFKFIKG